MGCDVDGPTMSPKTRHTDVVQKISSALPFAASFSLFVVVGDCRRRRSKPHRYHRKLALSMRGLGLLFIPAAWGLAVLPREMSRRACVAGLVFLPAIAPAVAEEPAEVRGIGVTPFNSLAFQYRGSDYGGLRAEDIEGPSVPYATFVERLKKGEVASVEFFAPDGDEAYVLFKGDKESIRIGEGGYLGRRQQRNKVLSHANICPQDIPSNNTMVGVVLPSRYAPSRMPVFPTSSWFQPSLRSRQDAHSQGYQ